MMEMPNEYGQEEMMNGIVEMIKNELQLDWHYLPATRNILVRVNADTINIPIFD